jgi:chromosome partitioning protein
MKTIAVLNYKGGVGKTTFAISVSQALALSGYRVLAIDNDSQHNLSLLLGDNIYYPNIRDVYRSTSVGMASKKLKLAIRESDLAHLHLITAPTQLCASDIRDPHILKKAITYTTLHRYYDFIIIDNSPGIDIIQENAIHAADEIFVPTELSFYAINGIREMHAILADRFRDACNITKIVPNFFKNTKRQNEYLDQLTNLYPYKVTDTAIPYDTVFDLCMKEGKTLFLHHLYSKAAAYYLKLIHELFNFSEDETWDRVMTKRKEKRSSDARKRYYKQLMKKKTQEAMEKNPLQLAITPLQHV